MIEKQKISELVSLQKMEKDMERQKKKEPQNKELIEVLTPKIWIL